MPPAPLLAGPIGASSSANAAAGADNAVSAPPLPDTLNVVAHGQHTDEALAANNADTRGLRAGCWLISYKPTIQPFIAYDGTFRVEHSAPSLSTVSGDLYQRRIISIPRGSGFPPGPPRPILLGQGPDPASGIPILPRGQYRYYLRVVSISTIIINGAFPVSFEMWKYTAAGSVWNNEGTFSANMVYMTGPPGYTSPHDYAEGDLKSAAGAFVGRFKMGWLSISYRKAVVEVDTARRCKVPVDSGFGHSWTSVFGNLGWDVSVSGDETNVTLASVTSGNWTDAQMHEAMLAHRKTVDLDSAWYYHILSVNTILSTPRGIMYDVGATDSDNVPREGVGIANDWIVPEESKWGSEQGKKFADSKPLFFRTAVHELGHAFGLYHDTADNGFMNTTDVIARNGTAITPFPTNIMWQYAPQGLRGLRHFPDPYVRPGGVAWGGEGFTSPTVSGADADISLDDLKVRVVPLQTEVPLGAPVRVSVELINSGSNTAHVPADISLKSEYVYGNVKKADGGLRTFKPLIRCVDETPAFQELKPGESVRASLTLLRGGQGALFHSSGLFEVSVMVRWPVGGDGTISAVASGNSTVYILPAENAAHAKAAHKLLTTPDTQLVLFMGQARKGHLKEGVDAIKDAVDDKVLGDYYAAVEARRLLQLGDEERVRRALKLIDGKDMVCSHIEKQKLHRLIEEARKDGRCEDDASKLVVEKLGVVGRGNSDEYITV